MIKILPCMLLVLSFIGVVDAESAENRKDARPWMLSVTTNTVSWKSSDVDNKGGQTIGYYQMAYDAKNWGVAVTGKAAKTSYKTTLDGERLNINTLTDTSISTFYNYRRKALTVRGGVDISLPTGKNSYSNNELKRIITDTISYDLMLLNFYGAGTNISPHLMAVYQPMERLTLGAGARYQFTGEYDATSDEPDDNINPGDKILAIINSAYRLMEEDYLLFTITFNRSGADTMNGNQLFRTGDTYSFETRYIRKWDELLSTIFSATIRRQSRNESLDGSSVLNAELSNSNNNSWEIFANNIYRRSRKLWLIGMLGYKSVSANGYVLGDALYDGGRSKYYIEPSVSWFFSKAMYATVRARYSKINDRQDAFSAKDAAYNVYNIDLGLTYSF